MQLEYVIVYVDDVAAASRFCSTAFGLKQRFADDTGDYAEMDTGAATLAFVSHEQAKRIFGSHYTPITAAAPPPGIEVALVTREVDAAYERAVGAGATSVTKPATQPWGQRIAVVRADSGWMVELCSPMESPA